MSKKPKVKYNEVSITLKFKGEQVWQYNSRQISSIIGKTVFPSIHEEILMDRLESCIPILNGSTKFHTADGTWKKKKKKGGKCSKKDKKH